MKRSTSLFLCALALCCMLILAGSMTAQNNSTQTGVLTNSQFNRAVYFDVSPPLREMGAEAVQVYGFHDASPALKPKQSLQQRLAGDGAVRPLTD